ncbi:unnamed protein product, partial [Mesorhabditis spiculigera]
MGTFTVSYWVRRSLWDKRVLLAGLAGAWYLGSCYDQVCLHRASMMKGHSKMFEERRKQILATNPHADVWTY